MLQIPWINGSVKYQIYTENKTPWWPAQYKAAWYLGRH